MSSRQSSLCAAELEAREAEAEIAYQEAVRAAKDVRDAANMATATEYQMAINAANAAYLKAVRDGD